MEMNKLTLFISLFALVVFYSCQEKEPLSSNPIVITGSALTSEKNVVNFTGNLLSTGDASPIDYGFVWSSKTSSPSISDYKFRFKKKPSKGSFEAEIDYDLWGDSVSYVRAFVETREAVIYGEAREFHAKSSLSPGIISISPKETTGNDTITIFGEHLTSKISDISIQYTFERFAGNWPDAKIVYADGKAIRFVLSNTPLTTSNNIYLSIKIRDRDVFPDGKINPPLYANVGPQIVGFYPTKVAKNGIVKVKVKNLVGTPDHFGLYSSQYGGYQEIDGIEGDSIRIKLNDYVRYGNHRLILVTINKGVTYTCYSKDSLEVRHPEITGIESNSPSAGDSVTIKGRYFSSNCSFYVENEVCPFQNYAEFKLINSTKIRLALPNAIIDGTNQLNFNTYDGFVSKFPVQIRSRWSVKNKLPESYRYATCVQSGDKLIFGNWSGNYSFDKDIYVYNITANSLNKIAESPDNSVYQAVLAKDDDVYLFKTYNASQSEPIPVSYKFNLNTKAWNTLGSVKLISGYSYFDQFSICSFNNQFYLKSNSSNEVYQYDLIKNNWTFLNSIPVSSVKKAYLADNKSNMYFYYIQYFYNGGDQSVVYSFKYNESQNSWKEEPKFGNVSGQVSAMFFDNDYYWFSSSERIFKYSADGQIVKSYPASYPLSQFYNGKFYGLVTYSDSYSCIIEFDPNKY
jgi:hypothetical protein